MDYLDYSPGLEIVEANPSDIDGELSDFISRNNVDELAGIAGASAPIVYIARMPPYTEIVGYLSLSENPDSNVGGYKVEFMTSTELRGRGIAKKLLERAVLNAIVDPNVDSLYGFASPGSEVERLLLNSGFKAVFTIATTGTIQYSLETSLDTVEDRSEI